MALMATPWKHPTTGFYYLRRQIPGKMRPAFGGKALWKVSLKTKSAAEANILFLQATRLWSSSSRRSGFGSRQLANRFLRSVIRPAT